MTLHIPHREPNWGEPTTLRYWLMLPIEYGGYGVMLFIVLSGFCIHSSRLGALGSGVESPSGSWRAFWKRRFFRLYPTYVAALAFTLVVWCYVINANYVDEQFIPADLLQHLTMTHNLTPDHPLTLNGPAWTLGMEEQLYVMYMAVLWFRTRGSIRLALVASFVTTMAWTVVIRFAPASWTVGPITVGSLNLWPFQFWFGWVLGAVAAEAYHGRIRIPGWLARRRTAVVALAFTTLDHPFVWPHLTGRDSIGAGVLAWTHTTARLPTEVMYWIESMSQTIAAALPWFVLINRSAAREKSSGRSTRRSVRVVAWIGMISYSLYLTHVPVIQLYERLSGYQWNTDLGRVAWRYPSSLAAMLAVGWVFFLLVERRFLVKRPGQPRAETPSTVAASES